MSGNFISAGDVFDRWRDDLHSGKGPTLWPVGDGPNWAGLEVGPGLVDLIGGAPGGGKTAFAGQIVFEALRRTPNLRALIASVEVSPDVLLNRELARLSGAAMNDIRFRKIGEAQSEAVSAGIEAIEGIADRLTFLRPPFSLANVAESSDAARADLILVDYVQRFAVGKVGEDDGEARTRANKLMDFLRRFADAGLAVLVVSAVGRSKDALGRASYSEGLSLASFRESSELEYGADSAYILSPEGGANSDYVMLKHLKSRHGECRDLRLRFDREHMSFTPAPEGPRQERTPNRKSRTAKDAALGESLAALWVRTEPAEIGKEGAANAE